MYEVIVTYRNGFRDVVMGRFPTDEEAQEKARQLMASNADLVRARVRLNREVKSAN
jgi:hypothetical protein